MDNIKRNWTGNFDSIEDAIIAIQNIKTEDGKILPFEVKWQAVVDAVNEINTYKEKITNG